MGIRACRRRPKSREFPERLSVRSRGVSSPGASTNAAGVASIMPRRSAQLNSALILASVRLAMIGPPDNFRRLPSSPLATGSCVHHLVEQIDDVAPGDRLDVAICQRGSTWLSKLRRVSLM